MGIKGRVGRHRQLGGKHCQNWGDDQKTIIDLLNRISPPNAGTGGSLKPRIVAGIASDELYSAIVAFEDKHFPGQRTGFVDPGGKMYQKLEALTTAAPPPAPTSPAPAPPAPKTPPAVITPKRRHITGGEITLLRSIFEETIPYGPLEVAPNFGNIGGEDNSITPGNMPVLSTKIWSEDYSDSSVLNRDRGTFIHEFTHVWQFLSRHH